MPRTKKTENAVPVLANIEEKNSELDAAFDSAIEQAKEEIASIDERAEFAISVVTQSIRTQATVAKGKVLLKLRERFDQVPELEGKWDLFLDSFEAANVTMYQWMSAAKMVAENSIEYGEDFLLNFGSSSLSRIQQLPVVVKEAVLEDAKESGEIPGQIEVREICRQPQTKLAKAMEDIEIKAERLAEIENGSPQVNVQEKHRAKVSINKLNETIETLKSQIAEDKIKKEMQEKESERLTAELDLLKFDDDAAREQRTKRVASSLIVSIPAVLADVQKYIAEKDEYPSKTSKSIDETLETLVNYLKPFYA